MNTLTMCSYLPGFFVLDHYIITMPDGYVLMCEMIDSTHNMKMIIIAIHGIDAILLFCIHNSGLIAVSCMSL